jgi:hypothetical protein
VTLRAVEVPTPWIRSDPVGGADPKRTPQSEASHRRYVTLRNCRAPPSLITAALAEFRGAWRVTPSPGLEEAWEVPDATQALRPCNNLSTSTSAASFEDERLEAVDYTTPEWKPDSTADERVAAPIVLAEPLAAATRHSFGRGGAAAFGLGCCGGVTESAWTAAAWQDGGVAGSCMAASFAARRVTWGVPDATIVPDIMSRANETSDQQGFPPAKSPTDPSRALDTPNAPGGAKPLTCPPTRADRPEAPGPSTPGPSRPGWRPNFAAGVQPEPAETDAADVASDLVAAGPRDAAMLRTLERLFATSVSARSLVHRDRNWILRTAVAQASPGSVWQSSEPVAALFCQRLMWLVAVVMALSSAAALAALCLAAADTLNGWELVGVRRLRFTALESRGGGGAQPSSAGISAFGLTTAAGCDVWPAVDGANITLAGPSMTVVFAEPVAAAGWWFQVLRPGVPADDPVRFLLEREGGEGDWEVVGSSSPPVLLWSGELLQRRGGDLHPTRLAADGVVTRFSFRTPWAWWMHRLGYMFVIMAGFGAAAAASGAGRPLASLACSRGLMAGIWLVDGAAAVAFAATGQPAVAWVAAVCAAVEICGSLALAYHQLLFRVWCLGAGATFAVLLFVHYLSLGLDPVPEILSAGIYRNHNTAQGVFAFVVGLHGFFSGWLSRFRASGLVAGDRKAYDALWKACCARDAGSASRAALALAVIELSAALPSEPVRQRCAAPLSPPCSGPASPSLAPPSYWTWSRSMTWSQSRQRDVESEQAVGPLVATLEQVPRRRRTSRLYFSLHLPFPLNVVPCV